MTTLGTNDEQVARLEALLKRIQVNAATLRDERGGGLEAIAPSLTPISDSPTSAIPVTAPTGTIPPRGALGTLPDFLSEPEAGVATQAAAQVTEELAALDANEPVTQVPPPPVFEDVVAVKELPIESELSLDSIESDLPTLPPSRDDKFEDPNTEHTKPLWLGLNNGTGTFNGEGAYAPRTGDAHRTLAETPAAKVQDTSVGYSTYGEPEQVVVPSLESSSVESSSFGISSLDSSSLESLAPSDGVADGPGLDIAAFDNGLGENGIGENGIGELGEEEHLDTSPPISGHRASSRSSELSAVGEHQFADPMEGLEQELEVAPTYLDESGGRISDAPPSVLGATITLPEESSTVSLELLEPPPSSIRSGQPGLNDELEAELPRTSFRAEYDSSLSAPPSAVEDLRAHDRAEQERKAFERRASRAPERVEVGHLSDDDLPPVLSSRPASLSGTGGLRYVPDADAPQVVFEGARPPLRSMLFLELLDASLSITTPQ